MFMADWFSCLKRGLVECPLSALLSTCEANTSYLRRNSQNLRISLSSNYSQACFYIENIISKFYLSLLSVCENQVPGLSLLSCMVKFMYRLKFSSSLFCSLSSSRAAFDSQDRRRIRIRDRCRRIRIPDKRFRIPVLASIRIPNRVRIRYPVRLYFRSSAQPDIRYSAHPDDLDLLLHLSCLCCSCTTYFDGPGYGSSSRYDSCSRCSLEPIFFRFFPIPIQEKNRINKL